MRTTIDIEDDLLEAVKEIARRQHVSAGKVISRLLRAALSGTEQGGMASDSEYAVEGFRPFVSMSGRIVTNEKVDQLRDDEGI